MKARAWPRGQLELWGRADVEGELLEIYLGALLQRGGELWFGPEIVFGGRRIGAAVALVVFNGAGQVLCYGVAKCGGLIQKHNRPKRALRKLEQGARSGFATRPEGGWDIPRRLICGGGSWRGRHRPFRERKERGAHHRSDRTLRAGIEFAHGRDAITEQLNAHGTRRLGRENVYYAAPHGKLSRQLHHFRTGVTHRSEMRDELLQWNFRVGG